ncbi:hypothetical protein ACMS1Z_15045 [Acidiphilium multivorum]|uniref:hypothetical protein n=1 Tax=Acidiphilium multivorum TaxID=62140 RepID=UPI0039C96ACA
MARGGLPARVSMAAKARRKDEPPAVAKMAYSGRLRASRRSQRRTGAAADQAQTGVPTRTRS